VGHWVNDVVYGRLAPGILAKVRELNPKIGDGRARKHKHFQFLTDDHGVPELREHLTKVMTVADIAVSMHQDFDQMLDRVLPRYGDTIELPFSDEGAPAVRP
jgi:hypothetical protein